MSCHCRWSRTHPVEDPGRSIRFLFVPKTQLEDGKGNVINPPRLVSVLKAYQELDICLVISDSLGDYTDEERDKTRAYWNGAGKKCPCKEVKHAFRETPAVATPTTTEGEASL